MICKFIDKFVSDCTAVRQICRTLREEKFLRLIKPGSTGNIVKLGWVQNDISTTIDKGYGEKLLGKLSAKVRHCLQD